MIIQGLGGRNKVDAPTATWEAARSFLDRATEAGAPVYSMLIARPFDRPVVIGRDQLPLPGRARRWDRMLKLPARRARWPCLRDPAARDEMRDAVENYNRDPAKGTTMPPPLWTAVFVDRVDQARAREVPGAFDPRHRRRARRGPGRRACSTWPWPRTSPPSSGGGPRAPSGREAVGEAQRDPRMIVGVSDGGAHLARDDGADWSSYFLRSWVLDRQVWTLEEGIRQITQVPAALLGLGDRGVLQPGGWADIMIFDPDDHRAVEEGVRPRPPRRRRPLQGLGQGRAGHVVNGVPIVLRRRAHRSASRPGGAPGMTSGMSGATASRVSRLAAQRARRAAGAKRRERDSMSATSAPWVFDADGHIVEPPTVWDELLPEKFREYAPRVLQ